MEKLKQIEILWGLTEPLVFHRHVANEIYFSKINFEEIVVRITDSQQRRFFEIQAELEWIQFLKRNQINVCQSIQSLQNKDIETIQIKEKIFYVVVFKKIQGERLQDYNLNVEIVRIWATNLAKMHSLATQYRPGLNQRKNWDKDSIYTKAMTALDETSLQIKNETLALCQWIKSLPISSQEFGLIHADLHMGNFFYDQNQMTIFDFDDSCYSWFLYDLAVPIQIFLRDFSRLEDRQKRDEFIKVFFETYFSFRKQKDDWKSDFIKFYKYRCLSIHLWLIAIQKERDLSDHMKTKFEESIIWEGLHPFTGDIEQALLNIK